MHFDAFSSMQLDFFQQATHRWNIKTGATRSGKTYMDYFVIPKRIMACTGSGLILLIGNTQGTLERNILEPMRNLYGKRMVGQISPGTSTIRLFGKKAYAVGGDKVSAVSKIQGAGVEYCYGDEFVTWNEQVFNMLKSRLDKENSCADLTGNPEGPTHWAKAFLDSDADIFQQAYKIYDNPFLPQAVVKALETEYRGTVYFDRYILGLWAAAEGVIYTLFANTPERYFIREEPNDLFYKHIGVDFGGNGSATTFVLTGISADLRRFYVLEEYYRREIMSPTQLEDDFIQFVQMCQMQYGHVYTTYADSAEQTLIQGLRTACLRKRVTMDVVNARKGPINDRIRFFCRLMGGDRFFIRKSCTHTIDALRDAVWDPKSIEDSRLDDGKHNIDSLDAMEYSAEYMMADMLAR